MDVKPTRRDVRELLSVVALALAGSALAAVVAFAPWYSPGFADSVVVELRGPVPPAAPDVQR